MLRTGPWQGAREEEGAVNAPFKSVLKRLGCTALIAVALLFGASVRRAIVTPVERPALPAVVNDITQLNPIAVARIITPTTTEEIVEAVKRNPGPISIGGGRYSMGGQTATEGALHIDMRGFNKILAFSPVARTITVQAGARWRQIQERIDPYGLSVRIMQTYANFTVGGSLSVNAHGRYLGQGPLVLSVRALKVVLANGALVEATPARNRELFYGVIGGYGGLGVITEATLDLTDNGRVKRRHRTMPLADYPGYFFREVRGSKEIVFHNADIYPDAYDTVHAVSYVKTDEPATGQERLMPRGRNYSLDRFTYWVISEWPMGKAIRQYIVDSLMYRGECVEWRNYEASYDVAELEPSSRSDSTYVLQEYFVPVERFDEFVPRMCDCFRHHRVNVINVSVRHAERDPGTIMAWARQEVFAFVVYYKQGTDSASREKVAAWTRELIDAAINAGGTYYLPYQPHATYEQFLRAYPRAPEFFALKRMVDPTNKFRNKLWDKYYDAYQSTALPVSSRVDPAGLRSRAPGEGLGLAGREERQWHGKE